jgi:hypothetical protein
MGFDRSSYSHCAMYDVYWVQVILVHAKYKSVGKVNAK